MKTIVAIATALGVGGIGIVRMSGEEALRIAKSIFAVANYAKNSPQEIVTENGENNLIQGSGKNTVTKKASEFGDEPNRLVFGQVNCEEFADKGYAVYFKAPNSFTGEDVVEFQLHGGIRILDGVVRECLKRGAVMAQRGEFTKRAYLNGKMSLADAEGVIDMINAESAAAVRAAYRLMNGEFGRQVRNVENQLLELVSALEASLDYPEEMEDEVLPKVPEVTEDALQQITKLLNTADVGRIVKHGINIALVGYTNVGKSSLLNAMLNRDRAIVTDKAGTTRDLVSESVEYNGVKFNLVDTAGIRESDDEIERIGVSLAINEIKSADVVLFVKDATQRENEHEGKIEKLLRDKLVFTVQNKSDCTDGIYGKLGNTFAVSAKHKLGIEVLMNSIYNLFKSGLVESGEVVTSQRHISALETAKSALENAKQNANENSIDCILIDLKEAVNALGEITGTTASEEVIDRIFSRFCVGK